MLRTGELAALRAAVLTGMADAALVERDNGYGLWQAVGTYPCRVVPKRSVTRETGGQLQGVTLWNVWLPWDADVRAGDRVRVGSTLYDVTGCDVGRTDALMVVAQCT